MNLDRFSGPGSTPSRRRFWDKVQEAVMASRKVEGRHVKIDEHTGAGSVINVDDSSTRRPTDGSVGACCYDDGTCDDLIESECTDAGGNWQGPGTTCDDDPPPCVGVCCEESGCVDDSTPDSCAADGGTWTDFGTTCDDDPPPCPLPACNDCGFDAFDGSGRRFLKLDYVRTGRFTQSRVGDPPCAEITITAAVDATDSQTSNNTDCTIDETSSASSYYHPTGFSMNCDEPTNTSCWDSFMAGLDTAYLFCASCAGLGAVYTDSGVVTDSATVQHRYQTGTGPDCTDGYDNETWTLSNECDVGGFSPPP